MHEENNTISAYNLLIQILNYENSSKSYTYLERKKLLKYFRKQLTVYQVNKVISV